MDYNERIARLQQELRHPLLVTHLANIRYLTGFAGSNAYLLVDPHRTVFVTDGRYQEVAGALVADLEATELATYHQGPAADAIAPLITTPQIGVESAHVSWEFVLELRRKVSAELTPTTNLVEAFRWVKDAYEIDLLEQAAAAGDAAFDQVRELAADATTESDLAWSINDAMRAAGGDVAGWGPIVAAGPNSALPHHASGSTPLGSGLLLLDFGCTVAGYHSDMTRTISLGDELDPEIGRIRDAVLEAEERAIAAIEPGIGAAEVDEIAREVLRGYGLAVHFVHGTGHGVGLEIHEGPRLNATSEDTLEEGYVVTVEPGVYLPGIGGVRIEDTVAVVRGGARILNRSTKELR